MAKPRQVVLSRSKGGTAMIFIFLLIVSVFMMLPLYYSVIQALKPIDEIFIYPPRFYVTRPTFDNFVQVFTLTGTLSVPVTRYLFNSIFVTIVGTIAYLFLAAMSGYTLAKGKFKGASLLYTVIVLALLFRPEVTAIPVYYIIPNFETI